MSLPTFIRNGVVIALLAALTVLAVPITAAAATPSDLVISGVLDGPLSGGVPKAIEVTAVNDIDDLSEFTLKSYANGGTSVTNTFAFPSQTLAAGQSFIYAYSNGGNDGVNAFFGRDPDATGGVNFNGDDAIVLAHNGTDVDALGVVGEDGTGKAWEYLDGWAYRAEGNGPTFPFDAAEWSFSGTNVLDGATTNAGSGAPFPIGTYSGGTSTGQPVIQLNDSVTLASGIGGTETVTVAGGVAPITELTLINAPSPAWVFTPNADNTSGTLTIPASAADDTYTLTFSATDTTPTTVTKDMTVTVGTPVQTFDMIHDVQGNGAATPMAGQTVTVQGVVVGDFQNGTMGTSDDELNGFFVQEEDSQIDGDETTSEGIFVYEGAAPIVDVNVGDLVTVTGEAKEFYDQTQITATDVIVVGPAPETPSPATITLPFESADFIERYEGMAVTASQPLYVNEYYNLDRFGEMVLTHEADGLVTPTQLYSPEDPQAAALAASNRLSMITLDDGRTNQNPALLPFVDDPAAGYTDNRRRGDKIEGLTGALGYGYGKYRIQVNPNEVTSADFTTTVPRPSEPGSVGGDTRVASFNVLNFFTTIDGSSCPYAAGCRGADSGDEYARQLAKLVTALTELDADVYSLVELENDTDDSTLAALVTALNAVPSTTRNYDFVATGQIGSDAIRVGIIYDTNTVSTDGAYAVLDTAAFVSPEGGAPKNRPALAQTFVRVDGGEDFTIVVNHLKSKGSACPTNPNEDLVGRCNTTREMAVTEMLTWLDGNPTSADSDNMLIMGDLNSYAMESPITTLTDAGWSNVITDTNAYSYVYDAQQGTLDYVFASSGFAQIENAVEYAINANEADLIDYNTDYGRSPSYFNGALPYRSSDHDPVLIGLRMRNSVPVVTVGNPIDAATDETVTRTITASDSDGTVTSLVMTEVSPASDGITFNETTGEVTVADTVVPGNYSVTFTATDNDGETGTGVLSIGVTNDAPTVEVGSTITLEEGTGTTRTITAADADGTVSALAMTEVSPVSDAITFDNGTLTITDTIAVGTYTATFTATDNDGATGVVTLDITVSAPLAALNINEVETGPQFSSDEYVELFGAPDTSLDGYTLVYFDDWNSWSVAAEDLDGQKLDANGFFVTTHTSDLISSTGAVGLYQGDAVDFPFGTRPTTAALVDALVYSGETTDELYVGLQPAYPIADEGANGNREGDSLSLCGGVFVAGPRTQGAENVCPAPSLNINEVETGPQFSSDEYVELFGAPNMSLDGYTLVYFDDWNSWSVAAEDLDGQKLDANGFFVTTHTSDLISSTGAVGLYQGDAVDFPTGTTPTTAALVDALVYSGETTDALYVGLQPAYPIADEGANGDREGDSLSLCGGVFVAGPRTQGTENVCPTNLTINVTTPVSVNLGDAAEQTITVTDATGTVSDLSVTGLPVDWTFVPAGDNLSGTLSIPDTATAGTYTLTFSATDDNGTVTEDMVVTVAVFGEPMINEVDADAVDTEFVELVGAPNTPLDGYVLVFFNGVNNMSYRPLDLDGYALDANGIFVTGNAGVNGVALEFPTDGLREGPAGVALYHGDASDFPLGSDPVDTDLVNAIVYGADADSALLAGLTGAYEADETVNDAAATESMSMCNGRFYVVAPTPGAENTCPAVEPLALTLTTPVTVNTGTAVEEIVTVGGGVGMIADLSVTGLPANTWTFETKNGNAEGTLVIPTDAEPGSYTLTFSATDDNETVTTDMVVEVNATPTVTVDPTSLPLAEGTAGEATFVAEDTDGTVTMTADGLVAGITFDPNDGKLIVADTVAAGSYDITVTATDDKGATAEVTLTVEVSVVPNEAPTLTPSVPALKVGSNEGGTVTFTATDDGAVDPTLAVDSDTLPEGFTFDSNSGELTVSDTVNDGIYHVTVTATDDQGETTELIYTVQIGDAPAPFINEVDTDTFAFDTEEFIELSGEPNSALDGYVLVMYTGRNNTVGGAVDLDGYSFNANGFFVVGNDGIDVVDVTIPSDSLVDNAPGAVALYKIDDAPSRGDAILAESPINAVVYGGTPADTALTDLTTYNQMDENQNDNVEEESISFCGMGFVVEAPTAGAPNLCSVPVDPIVTAEEDGSVSVTPGDNATETTIAYTTTDGNDVIVTVKKDAGSWAITTNPKPEGVSVDPSTGTVTIAEPNVKDMTPVSAVTKNAEGKTSSEVEATALDVTPPAAPTVESLVTAERTPTITGTSEPGTLVSVEINGETYTPSDDDLSVDNAGAWTLEIPEDKKLNAGTFDVTVAASDENQNTATDATSDEIEITAASVERLAGPSRIETSIAIAQSQFSDGAAQTVYLARTDKATEGATGLPLAVADNAPILLNESASLHPAIVAELNRVLAPGGTVVLLGGPAALAVSLEGDIQNLGFNVDRIFGQTRADTAVKIAERVEALNGGSLPADAPVLLSNGRDFAASTVAGAAAAHHGGVLVVADNDMTTPETDAWLAAHPTVSVTTVGVDGHIAYPSYPVVGDTMDRATVSIEVAEAFYENPTVVGIATNAKFPDVLTGAVHATFNGGPILMTEKRRLRDAVTEYITTQVTTDPYALENVYIYGGENALTAEVFDSAVSITQQ